MGHPAELKEMLVARWAELVEDPSLQDLPYKIELNEDGIVEMSPPAVRHGMKQFEIGQKLANALPTGTVITECPVVTDMGVRVPDVAWASAEFMAREGGNSPLSRAPEICVEVRSPSDSRRQLAKKVRAYIAAGAIEVWIVDEDGSMTIHSAAGEVQKSSFGISL